MKPGPAQNSCLSKGARHLERRRFKLGNRICINPLSTPRVPLDSLDNEAPYENR